MDTTAATAAAGLGARATNSVLDRALPRPHVDVNESAFVLLFSEICRNAIQNAQDVTSIEMRLSALGMDVGWRMLELVHCHQVQSNKNYVMHRQTRIIPALQFVTSACWQFVYGKALDSLERSTEGNDTYLLSERDPLPTKFASVPRDFGQLNLASFNAGVIAGLLSAQGFECNVVAHFAGQGKVVYVVKFDPIVMEREAKLARMQQQ